MMLIKTEGDLLSSETMLQYATLFIGTESMCGMALHYKLFLATWGPKSYD
jgi:hypothetical protein